MTEYQTVEHDVLVIGAGGAGLRAAIEAAGLQILQLTKASTRNEKGVPVPGLLVAAQR